jgi:hypothetical protein
MEAQIMGKENSFAWNEIIQKMGEEEKTPAKWKRLNKDEIQPGMEIYIANQHMMGCSIYTPRFAAGQKGIVLRKNECTVTVDILDGAKPVRCNYNDIGIYC